MLTRSPPFILGPRTGAHPCPPSPGQAREAATPFPCWWGRSKQSLQQNTFQTPLLSLPGKTKPKIYVSGFEKEADQLHFSIEWSQKTMLSLHLSDPLRGGC